MSTFTQIIFPPKIKPILLLSSSIEPIKKNILEFWFKDVINHCTKETQLFVMIKCPECNLTYEFMEIDPKQKHVIGECIFTNQLYYKDSAKRHCPRCRGNNNVGYA
jgi:phage FluMu protein Com